MTRPDLRLSTEERTAFLHEAIAAGEPAAFAISGVDGYPVVGLVEWELDGEALRLVGDVPPDGAAACIVVERGATYDDITAVVARGVVRNRCMPLDDVVSFAFRKIASP